MRALLILNEKSRRGAREGPIVPSRVKGCGIEIVRDPGRPDIDAVIVAGGDGTVIGAIPLAIAHGVPLAIIPLGTFNDLARTLRIPAEIDAVCELVFAGHTRAIDVGRVNGCYFVNEASVGLSTRIAREQTPGMKQRFGMLDVIATTLRNLRKTWPFFVELEYDGRVEDFRTVQLTVANSARFGGIIERPDASIDDGWLDLYSVEVRNWLEAFAVVGKIIGRDPKSGQGLRTRRSTRFEVRTRLPHHITADGEPAGTTPATFEVLPRAVRVFVA